MATSPHPLIWNVQRQLNNVSELGSVVHYYDETSQSLWINNGLKTSLADVPEGHWKSAVPEPELDIGTPGYKIFALDHAYNGVWFGVAMLGDELTFLRYVYAMDCSDLTISGSIGVSNDNSVNQLKANIMNIKESIFMSNATVFQPGARVTLKLLVKGEMPYNLCTVYLDSVDYNIASESVPISGRNNIGYRLMASTFDDVTSIKGNVSQIAAEIMRMAGVKKGVVESTSDEEIEFEFQSNETLLSGLQKVFQTYYGWKAIELSDGTVVMGSKQFVRGYQQNSYYVFDVGSVFKRKVKRSSDSAYTKVMVKGKDADGNDLEPVIVPVSNYSMWRLPANKTYHETVNNSMTQAELQEYAENVAAELQYIGVGEDFTCSMRPDLLVGDVAAADNGDGTMTTLGVVTSVKHSFGKSGFTTDFSTDSGGVMMESRGVDSALNTETRSLNGYTRKQSLKDIIQVASGTSNAGPQTSGTAMKVITNSNAKTLNGKTYEQIIEAAAIEVAGKVKQVPDYTSSDYGKFLTPTEAGLSWAEAGGNFDDGDEVSY